MDGRTEILAPRARGKGLIVRNVEDEMVVYDLERETAHLLNRTAALVWSHCDGQTTISELVELLRREQIATAKEQTVWHALLELSKDNLLEEQVSRPAVTESITRRQMMKRVGIATAAAAVTTLAIPAVGAHATCAHPCSASSDCTASGVSIARTCCGGCCCPDTCCTNPKNCNNVNCCSGVCCKTGCNGTICTGSNTC